MMDAAHPIGFIGLGTMGEAMALALVKAGIASSAIIFVLVHGTSRIVAAQGLPTAARPSRK